MSPTSVVPYEALVLIAWSPAILKEYRRLDDGITMRINRANALIRDEEREKAVPGTETVQNQ